MSSNSKMSKAQLLDELARLHRELEEVRSAAAVGAGSDRAASTEAAGPVPAGIRLPEANDADVRKLAEKALRESEEKLRLIVDHASPMIAILDRTTVYEYANPAYQILGFQPGELVGRSGLDLVHPDDRQMLIEELARGREQADINELALNYRLLARDGSAHFIRSRFSAIRDAAGHLEKIVIISDDVTRQQWLEESFRESELLLRETQAVAHVGGWKYDVPTGKLTWTDETRRSHEVPEDYQPDVERAIDFYAPEARPEIASAVEHCIREGTAFDLELPLITARGRKIFVHSIGQAVMDGGKVIKLLGTFQDITERKRVDQERELTVRLLSLLNQPGDTHEMIRSVTGLLHEWSGCEAVGIRLREGDDHPYYETWGFPARFVEQESRLCARDLNGQLLRDEVGNPVLDCMCGNIIRGRFDPSLPFFTASGSFWSNCTTELLASTSEADRQARTRNRCNGEGYESVALIPLRVGQQTFGLLQLNDRARDRFTPDSIRLFERLADSLALALSQRRAEEKLVATSKMLSMAQRAAGSGFWSRDIATGQLSWSPELNELFQVDLGTSDSTELWRKRLHPDDVVRVGRDIGRSLSTGEPLNTEYRMILPDGRTVWILAKGEISYDAAGCPVRMSGICMDVTSRKEAEDALRKSEAALKVQLESSPDSIMVLDRQQRFLSINRVKFSNALSTDEFIGRDATSFLPPGARERSRVRIERCFSTGEIQEFEHEVGDNRWVRSRVVPLPSAEGIDRVMVIGTEITERKHAEEQLQISQTELEMQNEELLRAQAELIVSQARYFELYDLAPVGYMSLSPGGLILEANQTSSIMLGRGKSDLVNSPLSRFILPADQDIHYLNFRNLQQDGNPLVYQLRLMKSDGSHFWARVETAAGRDVDGCPVCRLVMSDITERKRAAQALEESERALSNLISNLPGFIYRCANDRDWTMNFISAGCEPITGYAPDDLIDNRKLAYNDIVHPDYQQPLWEQWQEILTAHGIFENEYPIVTRDGGIKWVWERGRGIYGPGGDLLFLEGFITEVTEKMRAEEALRRSEERNRSILQTAMDGFWLADLRGRLLEVNESYCRMSGYSRPELLAMSISDVEALEQGEDTARNIARIVAECEDGFESRHRRKDGSVFDVGISVQYQPIEGGRLVAFIRDITDRKKAEEALRESRSILAKAEEVARIGSWKWDFASGKVRWSEGLFKLFEADPEQYQDDPNALLRERVHPEDLKTLAEINRRALQGEKFLSFEHRLVLPGGAVLWVNAEGNLDRDGEGRPVALSGYVQDITERKLAEDRLQQSEKHFREAFQYSPIGMALSAPDLKFTRVNSAFSLMVGYTEDELRSLTYADITHPDDLQAGREEVAALLAGVKDTFSMEKRYIRRDGAIVWGLVAVALIRDSGGAPVHFIFQVEDITDRRQIEEERLKSQRLESIGVLAGGIAHDFNNILMGIMGNMSLARMEMESGENATDSLHSAEQAVNRARDLTRQLLTFSRGGTPLLRLESIRQIVEEAVGFVRHGSNVLCDMTFGPGLWPAVVDAGQVSQVVNNLVINAIQAMPDGGNVLVRAENVELPDGNFLTLPSGRYVMVSVADRGLGIPPEVLPKIFDPYFTTKTTGSGLGLATSYSIISRHNGRIEVESEPGRGTVFRVYLPAAGDRPVPADVRRPALLTGSGRVLVMDDEESVRVVARRMLVRLGYTVEEAKDGAEAVEKFRVALDQGQPFAALIFDLTVPGGMGGQQAVGEIRRLDPRARVVVASGYSDDPVMSGFREFGFSAVVAKPYRVEDLGLVLHELLGEPRDQPE